MKSRKSIYENKNKAAKANLTHKVYALSIFRPFPEYIRQAQKEEVSLREKYKYFGMYKLFRAEIAQSTVRSFGITMLSPVLDDDTGFA